MKFTITLFTTIALMISQALADPLLDQARYIRMTEGPMAEIPVISSLIKENPTNVAYLFERGVAFSESGKCRSAYKDFKKTYNILPHNNILQNINTVMNNNCLDITPKWQKHLSFSVIADNNYNNATQDKVVYIGNLPFTLSDSATAQERYGFSIGGGISYNQKLGWGQTLSFGISGNLIILNEKEDNIFKISPNITYTYVMDKSKISTGIFARIGYDIEGKDEESFGITTEYSRIISNKNSFALSGSYTNLNFRNPNDSGEDFFLNTSFFSKQRKGIFQVNLIYGYQTRPLESDTMTTKGISASYTTNISESLKLEIGIGYTQKEAAGVDSFFRVVRNDDVYKINTTISFSEVKTMFGTPYLSISHIVSNSNHPLYDYNKTGLTVGFTKEF